MPLNQQLTGVGHYTLELVRAMAQAAPHDEFEIVSPFSYIFEEFEGRDGLPANVALARARTSIMTRRWWSIGLPSHLKRNPVALFHGTNYEVPLRAECPTVVTIHDLSLLLHSSTHEARAVRRSRLLLPLMARKATLIVTPSELVRDEVCEHLKVRPEKVFAIPLAPRGSFTPMPSAQTIETRRRLGIEDEFLLFVGTIEPRKNLLTLVKALEEVLRTTELRPQVVVAGKVGWKSDELLSHLDRSPARERVHFVGFLPDEDLRALYSCCRAFIYPSLYEGFGLPPLEAMACGAPVIASRVPSIKESVARIISATDSEGLARNVIELLREDQARQLLFVRGLKHAQEFSWQRTAALTREVYAQALKSTSSSVI